MIRTIAKPRKSIDILEPSRPKKPSQVCSMNCHRMLIRVLFWLLLVASFSLLLVNSYLAQSLEVHNQPKEAEPVKHHDPPPLNPKCTKLLNHVAFINLPEAGSDTYANVIYRYALQHNLTTLSLSDTFSDLDNSFIPHMLENHPLLEKLPEIHISAESSVFNKEEYLKVMPKDTVFISSLRDPFDYFKSFTTHLTQTQNYPELADSIGNLQEYFSKGKWKEQIIQNRMSRILGLKSEEQNIHTEIWNFLNKTENEFMLMLIEEDVDQSLIVLRRKLCWDIGNIFHNKLDAQNVYYTSSVDLRENFQEWSNADSMLYERFNDKLRREIAAYSYNLWHELDFFKSQTEIIHDFCRPIEAAIKVDEKAFNPKFIRSFIDSGNRIIIPASEWGELVKIDHVWCLMSKINTAVLRNFFRVRQYPKICKYLAAGSEVVDVNVFKVSDYGRRFLINPGYCSKAMTHKMSTYQVPKTILLNQLSYNRNF